MKNNKAIWILVVILIVAAVAIGWVIWRGNQQESESGPTPTVKTNPTPTPSPDAHLTFDNFRIEEEEVYTGDPADPDFTTHPSAEQFITRITEGAEEGPNFAGKYTVIEWGCGTNCGVAAILDTASGDIVEYGIIASYGFGYRLNSALFIVNPRENMPENPNNVLSETATDYYVMESTGLRHLAKLYPGQEEPVACTQVIVEAENPVTGERQEYPTPCDVPSGWEIISPGK